ncbi:hypothetical protein [Mycoplasma suis]|uniref:Uncharacterized protein n=2 Tax=Mycoplasma suis TaxID=57372 RepID=F0QQ90_MYCSL|nr:hypothetical protein [Mycoplasma suis]ADX97660.1 hypothetical protein MSU_0116 [Mycoplasma suis str. Illinois]CBZ40197.1 hypothetical protein MSUIS_01040 [Mycoplasma suis KI3806]
MWAKTALLITSLAGGVVGGSYLFRDNLKAIFNKRVDETLEKVEESSSEIIAEYIYNWNSDNSSATCSRVLEGKSKAVNLTSEECKGLAERIWKDNEEEKKTKILVIVGEKYLKEIFGGGINPPLNENYSYKLKEGLKAGISFHGKQCKSKEDLKMENKVVVLCEKEVTNNITEQTPRK